MPRGSATRRGSTIAECVFTLALCVGIMGAATLLYGYATKRTLDTVGLLETGDGTDRLANEIDFLVRTAIDGEVRTVGGRTVLKLTMPEARGERNANGLYDAYSASFAHPRGGDAILPGERVWIYCGSPTAAIATTGDVPLLARRSDDATPALADVDWRWTYRDGTGKADRRSPSATTFTFAKTGSTISWTIAARSGLRTAPGGIDTTNELTFRDARVDGATLLNVRAPQ